MPSGKKSRARAVAVLAAVLTWIVAACNTSSPTGTQSPPSRISSATLIAAAGTPTNGPGLTSTTFPTSSSPVTALPTIFPTTEDTPAGTPAGTPLSLTALNPAVYTWTLFSGGLQTPVGLTNAADGSERLFVIDQQGCIRILHQGVPLPDPFLDLTDRVGSSGLEQGLLGLAFHPRFAENGYFYVNYTDLHGDTVIARFTVSPQDGNQADPGSEQRLIFIDQPYANHNGGATVFGPDGYLYLGLGDGGAAGDPLDNGQSTDSLLGKILRIDVDAGNPYAIPPDNPFASGGGRPEIWAYGLRNPWRFSFDRLTGDLYIGDVGQGSWEEIDFLPAGAPGGVNFGWNYLEGGHPFQGTPPAGLELVPPVAEYSHAEGISVIGGVVYRGAKLPELQGMYLYGDYGSGRIWGLWRSPDGAWQSVVLFQTNATITSFGEDEDGEIYLVDHAGDIYRLERRE